MEELLQNLSKILWWEYADVHPDLKLIYGKDPEPFTIEYAKIILTYLYEGNMIDCQILRVNNWDGIEHMNATLYLWFLNSLLHDTDHQPITKLLSGKIKPINYIKHEKIKQCQEKAH